MAQTNFTPIQIYSSSTPTNAPSAGNLTNSTLGAELAINIADKNLFFKDSTNAVNTVPIRQSGASSNGWLSSTDWNTFNNKSNTNGTVTSVAALIIGTTGTDLSSTVANGTTTPVITLQVPTASAANRGALSSTDWSTFNNKQAALISGTNIKTVGGASLLGSGDVTTLAGNITLSTGNLVIATSGKGIDFSATPGTGTSELLNDYEEGTWTPGQGAGLTVVGTFSSSGNYTKVGNMVFVNGIVAGSTSVAILGGVEFCTGLPFVPQNNCAGTVVDSNYAKVTAVRTFVSVLYHVESQSAVASLAFSIVYRT